MTDTALAEGATVGRFVIVRQLGAGGMGTVYEARDPELSRSVAVKLLREPDQGGDRHLAMRLLREAKALAQLQHPNVVTVYELGLHADQVFVAMELVDGESLDRYFTRGRSSWRSVVGLFLQAARGLAAAHAKGLVHRDVKPANLFVDDDGRVRVGDFGLARLADDDDLEVEAPAPDLARELRANAVTRSGEEGAEATDVPTAGHSSEAAKSAHGMSGAEDSESSIDDRAAVLLGAPLTRAGALVGTPGYMAPEQLRGRRGTPASDQFSFCLAMWKALFGEHAFAGSGQDLARAIIEGRRREVRVGRVPGWLVRALERGLAADPAQRHPSMAALIRVLERGTSRRRAIITTVAAVIGAVIAISTWRVLVEMRRADRQGALATARADDQTLAQATSTLARDPTASLALLRQLSPGASQWRAARTVAADAYARGIAAVYGHADATAIAMSADGVWLASCGGGMMRSWKLSVGEAYVFPGPGDWVLTCAFAPDGAILTVDTEGHVDRFDAITGARTRMRTLAPAPELELAALTADTRKLFVADERHQGRLVDLASGAEIALPDIDTAAWSQDGAALAGVDHRNQRIVHIDPASGIRTESVKAPVTLSLATDGTHVWAGTWDGLLLDVAADPQLEWISGHKNPITHVTALGDGTVASATSTRSYVGGNGEDLLREADHAIGIADISPTRVGALRGHPDEVIAIAAAQDGDPIASLDGAGEIRVWRRAARRLVRSDQHTLTTHAVLSGDGRTLVLAQRNPALVVRDVVAGTTHRIELVDGPPGFEPPMHGGGGKRLTKIGTRRLLEVYRGEGEEITELTATPDRRLIATLDSKKRAAIWDLATRRGRVLADEVERIAICGDGHVITNNQGTPTRHVFEQGQGMTTIAGTAGALTAWTPAGAASSIGNIDATTIACSDDGDVIAAADRNGDVHLVARSAENRWVRTLGGNGDRIQVLAFDAGRTRLVGGGRGRRLHVWNLVTGALRVWPGHAGAVTLLAFGPDGRLASASVDGMVRVWNLDDGASLELRGHVGPVRSINWSKTGEALVTAGDDATVRVWDLVANVHRVIPGSDLLAAFTPDETEILAVDHIDGISWHADDLPRDEAGLRAWLESMR